MRSALAAASAAGVALAASVSSSYAEFRELEQDRAVEAKLPSVADAQKTRVVRLRRLLSHRTIDELHAFRDSVHPRLGSAGRTSDNMAAAYRAGAWEVDYLNTDGALRSGAPELRRRLVDAVMAADAEHFGGMLDGIGANPRCVEYHVVEPGGSLPYVHHHDGGSLLTIDVMLSDRSDRASQSVPHDPCRGAQARARSRDPSPDAMVAASSADDGDALRQVRVRRRDLPDARS